MDLCGGSPTCNLDSLRPCVPQILTLENSGSNYWIRKIQTFTFYYYYLFYNFDCHPKDQVVICLTEA